MVKYELYKHYFKPKDDDDIAYYVRKRIRIDRKLTKEGYLVTTSKSRKIINPIAIFELYDAENGYYNVNIYLTGLYYISSGKEYYQPFRDVIKRYAVNGEGMLMRGYNLAVAQKMLKKATDEFIYYCKKGKYIRYYNDEYYPFYKV